MENGRLISVAILMTAGQDNSQVPANSSPKKEWKHLVSPGISEEKFKEVRINNIEQRLRAGERGFYIPRITE
ncbi:MAG: hypothetical protein Q7K55_09415 [Candidatus Levybacteria bacterium]|nr:hypothetical protein [Candidatus Levybacteria bacterium]